MIIECIKLNWLCKHEKGQKQPSNHSCTELNKIQFFPEVLINIGQGRLIYIDYQIRRIVMFSHQYWCFSGNWTLLRLKTEVKIITPLAHFSVNTRSPPKSFERVGLFAVTALVTILLSWRPLMTPPNVRVPRALPFTFFSILEYR